MRLVRWDDYVGDMTIMEWIGWIVNEKAYDPKPTDSEGAD